MDDEELEVAFVHEVAHLPLKRMQIAMLDMPDSADRTEETTTQVARMLILARAAGERDGRAKPKRRVKCRRI